MNFRPLQSIRQSFFLKMALTFTFFTFLLSLFFTLFFIYHQYRLLSRLQIENGRILSGIIARNATLGVISESTELLSDAVWSAFEQEDVTRVFVYNPEARLLVCSDRKQFFTEATDFSPPPERIGKIMADLSDRFLKNRASRESPILHREDRDSDEFWCGVISASGFTSEEAMVLGLEPAPSPRKMAGLIGLVVDRKRLKSRLSEIALQAAGFGLIFWLAGCIVIFWFIRRFTRPLRRLNDGVRALGQGLEADAVIPETGDEIGALAVSFNDMAASLRFREAALQKSEQKYRSIFENAADGIFQADTDGRLITANPAMAQIFGHSSAKAMCAGESDIFDLLCIDAAKKTEMGDLFGGDFSRALEISCRNRQGKKRHLLVHLHMVESRAEERKFYEGLIRDVTGQKRSEEMKIAKEAAEASAEAKSRFLANMSHEIRTPLGAISGLVGMMGKTDLTPLQSGYLGKIESSSRLLLRVINDILDVSKIEAGKLHLEKITFSWHDLMESIQDMFAERAREENIRLFTDWDDRIPPYLNGDAERIRQVLINLIGNALKFTPEGGQVNVKASVAEMDQADIRIGFSVQDTGIGISEEKLKSIFDAFTQADDSMSRRYGGTGLGLSICRQLVELMGGTIHAESRPEQGTDFRFTLLLKKRTKADLPARVPNPPEVSLSGARVLIAEDHEINQEVALSLLEPLGLAVDIADNGMAAWNAARSRRYDAILMDLQMPEMDGLEATRRIRRLDGDAGAVPIIAMTAHALAESRNACIAAGMNDFLTKPLDQDRLVKTLSRWLAPKEDTASGENPSPSPPLSASSGSASNRSGAPDPEPERAFGVIDFEEGALRMGGKPVVFEKILFMFHSHYKGAADEILDDLNAGNPEEALRKIHTLKGTAGNCAAHELVSTAARLETEIREGRKHNGAFAVFADALSRVIETIEGLRSNEGGEGSELPENPSPPSPSPESLSPEMRSALCAELLFLDELLQKNNMRAIPEMDRLRDRLVRAAGAGRVAALERRIENLDFAGAGEMLQQIVSTLEPPSSGQREGSSDEAPV